MKKRIIALLCMAALSCTFLTGCAGKANQTEKEIRAEQAVEPQAVSEAKEPETEEPEEEEKPVEEKPAAPVLEDGIYTAEFDTDSGMFRVNEACDGKGTLTVEDGRMMIHISLVSKNIVNLFPGSAEEAQKEGAEILQPTEDTVTYSDGFSEEVYGFDIPVPVLDEEFDLALIGKKGTWYDHKVSVSNPEKTE